MAALSFYAGESAFNTISKEGINPDLFSAFIGASGGPKWFVLAGLDKVIFNEFLDKSIKHIDIIGSSAGAFRASCFAQSDPSAAICRLADSYSQIVYSEKPSVEEVTNKGYILLNEMMGANGITEAINNKKKSLHVVLTRCHGLTKYENKFKQLAGLSLAAYRNLMGRKYLKKSFTRVVMSSSKAPLTFSELEPIPTQHFLLNEANFTPALMASGSIPVVIKGVDYIEGPGKGMYRDGGIIDYHFDIKLKTEGLVLYPHFYSTHTPGWFDKSYKNRTCHMENYRDVLSLAPSHEFVSKLPYGKIPDRKDFETLSSQDRIKYWKSVIAESERLADEFMRWLDSSDPAQDIQKLNLKR